MLRPVEPLDAILFATAGLCLAGLLASARVRLAQRRRVGTLFGRDSGSWRARSVTLVLLVAVLAGPLVEGQSPDLPALAALLLALVLTGVRPGFGDRVCGSAGLRRGWVVRSFDELEEWRLIGEHLRFKLFGQWEAVPLAPEHHAAVRARLVELVPERESGFGHGLEHPDRREAVRT